ncbi:MAG TPA: respiratory nitrate reductase subunit gamma [Candidatus Dormibacteraeota bacterium]|nr:respiratory nitrate reductase subunit gamma [Candidatus Dormibacteraeota bacterium]
MSGLNELVWVALPYIAIAIFVAGHVWRYRHDKFGWTSRSTQILESRWLAWGSNLFHFGALAAIGGHVLGILIPAGLTAAVGVDEAAYHILSASAGTAAGVVCAAGLVILVWRRLASLRVWRTTTYVDMATYVLLILIITLGLIDTVWFNTIQGGYDYRHTVAEWFRGIFLLNPRPELMVSAPLLYQLHAASAWLLFALWPFSRLVHAWSLPFQYLGRPYILYRSRYAASRR